MFVHVFRPSGAELVTWLAPQNFKYPFIKGHIIDIPLNKFCNT
jgi:hypothetical protein